MDSSYYIRRHNIRLYWVLGHCGIDLKEMARKGLEISDEEKIEEIYAPLQEVLSKFKKAAWN